MSLQFKLQSQPKVVGTLKLYHVSPILPNEYWKMSRFFQEKGKKITRLLTLCVQSRGELLCVPTCLTGISSSSSLVFNCLVLFLFMTILRRTSLLSFSCTNVCNNQLSREMLRHIHPVKAKEMRKLSSLSQLINILFL